MGYFFLFDTLLFLHTTAHLFPSHSPCLASPFWPKVWYCYLVPKSFLCVPVCWESPLMLRASVILIAQQPLVHRTTLYFSSGLQTRPDNHQVPESTWTPRRHLKLCLANETYRFSLNYFSPGVIKTRAFQGRKMWLKSLLFSLIPNQGTSTLSFHLSIIIYEEANWWINKKKYLLSLNFMLLTSISRLIIIMNILL